MLIEQPPTTRLLAFKDEVERVVVDCQGLANDVGGNTVSVPLEFTMRVLDRYDAMDAASRLAAQRHMHLTLRNAISQGETITALVYADLAFTINSLSYVTR